MWGDRHSEEVDICRPGRELSLGTESAGILDFQFPELWNIKVIFNLFLMFIFYLFFWERERERERASGGRAQREGDTEFKAGFRFQAVSTEPDVGLKPTYGEIMTWAKVGGLTDWTARRPRNKCFFKPLSLWYFMMVAWAKTKLNKKGRVKKKII